MTLCLTSPLIRVTVLFVKIKEEFKADMVSNYFNNVYSDFTKDN